jgi:hypothetical protein
MQRTFSPMVILLISMVGTLMQEPRLQNEALQNAVTSHFKVSILRQDGQCKSVPRAVAGGVSRSGACGTTLATARGTDCARSLTKTG